MRSLQWYKRGAAYLSLLYSVMDIPVFGVSITLFKYLCISVLKCVVYVNRDG